MSNYEELAASRREWIDEVLVPWCRAANRKELFKAEGDWANLAGDVDPEKTLWSWAWSRFPDLVHPEMSGLDESREVVVRLNDGRDVHGFPDARRSERGELVLVTAGETDGETPEAIPIDDIQSVRSRSPSGESRRSSEAGERT